MFPKCKLKFLNLSCKVKFVSAKLPYIEHMIIYSRACTSFLEDQNSVSSIHIDGLQPPVTPASGISVPSGYLHACTYPSPTYIYIYII